MKPILQTFWMLVAIVAALLALCVAIAGKSCITGVLLCAVALYESSWRRKS